MIQYRLSYGNGKYFIGRLNERLYVHSTGEPEIQFAPLAVRNRSFLSTIDSQWAMGRWAYGPYPGMYDYPKCTDIPDEIYYDFVWSYHNPYDPELGKYNADLFAIYRGVEVSGVMEVGGYLKEGFAGQYRMLYDPEYDTGDYIKCEPFKVDSISGTGNELVAKTVYASGSSFYNAWKIDEIEFSSGHFPRLKFVTEEDAQNFANIYVNGEGVLNYGLINAIDIPPIGEPEPSWAYAPEEYRVSLDQDHYEGFTNHSGLYVWNEHLIKVGDGSDEYIARESGLLAYIENKGTNTNHIYINLKMEDGLVEPLCVSADVANPQISRRKYLEDILEQTYNEYRTTGPLHNCSYIPRSYLIKGINKYGQGPFIHPDDNNDRYLSTLGIGYSIPGIDYPMAISSNVLSYVQISPPTSNPWFDSVGNTWTLLSVTGTITELGGTVTYLTTWLEPGKLAGTEPNNWYSIRSIEELWRVSGPSGEFTEKYVVENCDVPEYRSSKPAPGF